MQFGRFLILASAATLILSAQDQDTHRADRAKNPPVKANAPQGKPINTRTPKQNPAQANQKPVTIPANAERLDSNHFRAKDEQGVEWNYVKTPFGIVKSKSEDESKLDAAVAGEKAPVIATDQGDTVKFERKTPFGSNVWTKKKSELDDSEKQALAAAAAQTSSNTPK